MTSFNTEEEDAQWNDVGVHTTNLEKWKRRHQNLSAKRETCNRTLQEISSQIQDFDNQLKSTQEEFRGILLGLEEVALASNNNPVLQPGGMHATATQQHSTAHQDTKGKPAEGNNKPHPSNTKTPSANPPLTLVHAPKQGKDTTTQGKPQSSHGGHTGSNSPTLINNPATGATVGTHSTPTNETRSETHGIRLLTAKQRSAMIQALNDLYHGHVALPPNGNGTAMHRDAELETTVAGDLMDPAMHGESTKSGLGSRQLPPHKKKTAPLSVEKPSTGPITSTVPHLVDTVTSDSLPSTAAETKPLRDTGAFLNRAPVVPEVSATILSQWRQLMGESTLQHVVALRDRQLRLHTQRNMLRDKHEQYGKIKAIQEQLEKVVVYAEKTSSFEVSRCQELSSSNLIASSVTDRAVKK